ncbi:uncharacterized protein LOC123865696 isoform X2 [Maniola jurtina]|uniref:uncharacterized protein LOC123865696 isoform X2 n=1 Tax=Maniola jurtina TaxID=191418 RepID=UPI001E68A51A|nr:uncharacterized protein LOC123865696 isoform X2 [Maniola jurtina]
MKRLWICVAFVAIFGNLATADDSDEQNSWYYDDWYDENFGSTEYAGGETEDNSENKYVEDLPSDVRFRTTESDKHYDIHDYQFEDNRSEVNEDSINNVADDTNTNSEKNTGKQKEIEYLTSTEVDNLGIDLSTLNIDKYSSIKSDSDDKILETPLEIEERKINFEKKIFEDTKSILSEETENDFTPNDIVELNTEKTTAFTQILEETSRLLDETLDTMEVENNNSGEQKDQQSKSNEEIEEGQETTEEDTLDQAISDFRADLKRLRETWGKLNDYDDNILESNDEDTTPVNSFTSSNEVSKITDDNKNKGTEKQLDSISEVFPDDSQPNKETTTSQPILYLHDALPATDSEITLVVNETENISSSIAPTHITQDLVLGDAFQPINRNSISEPGSTDTNKVTQTTPKVEDLSSSEVKDLMKNFTSQNLITEITQSDVRNANKVWLTVNSSTIITSTGYPSPYPTNLITDWLITGDGIGIELNITDFVVNGHAGDYLLFKPGGVDESGSTGLIFSYALHKERRYRFLDVDRMFVRFETKRGPQVMRGFSFSVRMVVPRPGAPEPIPEPEPVLPEPPETIILNLGGVSLEAFLHIEEQFRQIVAEMAATYITNNGIDPGVNTTLELTQIRSRALCFHNWPKFEQCVEVSFGVPLVYEDDDDGREPRLNAADLTSMWETYSQLEPYAERLRSLGITEYQVPNDRGILTVWLVIAGGVVISMTMLAFALWRFSCFEDYTRMPAFSDTDSIKEKCNLDLYPTPHQTLPPLYSDTDYKWADQKYDNSTKVDVRGYSNKSYMREGPYDLDSDDDIVPVSARYTTDV